MRYITVGRNKLRIDIDKVVAYKESGELLFIWLEGHDSKFEVSGVTAEELDALLTEPEPADGRRIKP